MGNGQKYQNQFFLLYFATTHRIIYIFDWCFFFFVIFFLVSAFCSCFMPLAFHVGGKLCSLGGQSEWLLRLLTAWYLLLLLFL